MVILVTCSTSSVTDVYSLHSCIIQMLNIVLIVYMIQKVYAQSVCDERQKSQLYIRSGSYSCHTNNAHTIYMCNEVSKVSSKERVRMRLFSVPLAL